MLGGRIFVKNLTIVSADQTISILSLTITWRYWNLRLVRLSDFYFSETIEPDKSRSQNEKLSPLITVKINGFEVFMHNRSFAYDQMMETLNELQKKEDLKNGENSDKKSEGGDKSDKEKDPTSFKINNFNGLNNSKETSSDLKSDISKTETSADYKSGPSYTLRFLLKILPIQIKVKRGAIVMGNVQTPTILVVSYKAARGLIDITKAPNPLDNYRFLYNFSFDKFQVSLKDNICYDKTRYQPDITKKKQSYRFKGNPYINQFKASMAIMKNIYMKFKRKKSIEEDDDAQDDWKGLRRYIINTGDANILAVFNDEEYAKNSLIVDATSASINYYFDSPGLIGVQVLPKGESKGHPEHGVEMELSQTTIHYGPWADKKRIPIQNFFFPTLFRDSKPTEINLDPNGLRDYAGFKIHVSVKNELILKIPSRESSKDKELLRTYVPNTKLTRSYGWLEIKMKEGSNFTQFSSYIADEKEGWPNTMNAYFNDVEVRSSVNHDIFFKAKSHELNASIGNPLQWNGTPKWVFDNVSEDGELFFLREHTLLFSDICTDFASGEPTPYELMKSFLYTINWRMNNYKIFLNVNDQNIINNPLDFSNNTYLSFQGLELDINMEIPLHGSLSKSTTISYDIFTPQFDLVLDTPPWHTVRAFLDGSNVVGSSDNFTVEGSYTFFDLIEVNASNHMEINCAGDHTALLFYGFVIKYLFIIKENYFGENIQFKTFEEYTAGSNFDSNESLSTSSSSEKKSMESEFDYWKILKTDNDIDTCFTFQVRDGLVIFPCNIYDCNSHIGLSYDFIDVDIRFTNFYMDLQADISPVKGAYVDESVCCTMDMLHETTRYKTTYLKQSPDIQFSGLSIHAHRMFGIPPMELTYNAKWDFAMGDAQINSTSSFISSLSSGLQNFVFGYVDFDNCLNVPEPNVYDAFSISFKCSSFVINLFNNPLEIVSIDLNSIVLSYLDYPNIRYTSRTSVLIPVIAISVIEIRNDDKYVAAFVTTGLILDIFGQKKDQDQVLKLKHEHLHLNDAPFHRNPYLLFEEYRDHPFETAYGSLATSLSMPNANYPLVTPSDRSKTFNLESGKGEGAGVEFSPLHDYDDEEFKPLYPIKDGMEYDSIVVELLETKVVFNPLAIRIIAEMINAAKRLSLLTVVDALQILIVASLKRYMRSLSETVNLRVIMPEVALKFGVYNLANPMDLYRKSSNVPVITLVLSEVSIALSLTAEKAERDHLVDIKKMFTIALHLKDMLFSVWNPESNFSIPLLMSIKDIEFWNETTKLEDLVVSPTVEHFTLELLNQQISWLIDYAIYVYKEIEPALHLLQVQSPSMEQICAEMVYKLTLASAKYRIDHDPEVLTKPAYILRSKKDHVRFYDGWKVMTKLKHVFDNLPQQWKDEQTVELHDSSWVLPDTAYDEVRAIFSQWRSWEADNEQRDFFFNHIFKKESSVSKGFALKVMIANIQIKLKCETGKVDSMNFGNLSTVIHYNPLEDAQFNRFGIDILDFANDLDVVMNVDSFSLNVSAVLIEAFVKIKAKLATLENEKTYTRPVDTVNNDGPAQLVKSILARFALTLKKYEMALELSSSILTFKGKSSLTSGEISVLPENPLAVFLTVTSINDVFHTSLLSRNRKLLNYTANQFSATAATSGTIEGGLKILEASIGRSSIELLDEDGKLLQDLKVLINQDVEYVKDLLKMDNNVPLDLDDASIIANSTLGDFGDFSIKIHFNQLLFVSELLSPLRIAGEFEGITLSALKTESLFQILNLIDRFQGNAKVDRVSVLEFQFSRVNVDARISVHKENYFANISTNLGYSQIQITQLINSLNAFTRHKNDISARIEEIAQLSLGSSENTDDLSRSDNSLKQKIFFSFMFSNEYFGLSTYVHSTRFALEIEETSLGVFNIDAILDGITGTYTEVPIFGEASIQNARFNTQDTSVPVKLSQILELNVTVRLFNKEGDKSGLQRLQIKSKFCRICLSNPTIFKLVNLFDTISALKPNTDTNTNFEKSTGVKNDTASLVFGKLSSIQVLSYNFCVGWIFKNSSKDYPGVMLGAERFFAVAEDDLGKYTLMDAYISVANGARSSNFYNTASQKSGLNRAFLPTMQLVYSIEEIEGLRNLLCIITGDEVDIKFLSNSVAILKEAVVSINDLQSFLKGRTRNVTLQAKKKPEVIPDADKFHSPFDNVEVNTLFAGSKIVFYHIDDCNPESASSICLVSPAVKIAGSYTNRNANNRKHIVKLDILTTGSENVLYCTCVPTVVELIEGMQSMMKKANSNKSKTIDVNETKSGVDLDVGKLFEDVDLHVGIKIEKQLLTFSCEPTAKVAAIVGVDGIHVLVNTLTGDHPILFASACLDNLSASLQHIYSREISGSARIERIIATSSFEFKDVASVVSSGSISNVEGYINMKQYQDLELFKDIWYPRKYFDVNPNDSKGSPKLEIVSLASNKSISNRFKEVSTTYAFPWVVTFVMSNASLQVDFGQALGNFKLNVDNLWAVSKKSTDWSQELKLGVYLVNLLSDGRMGTNFAVDNINIHTAISWKIDSGEILDVPIISASGGIDSLSLKLSFDHYVFSMASIKGLSIDIYNQKSEVSIIKNHILANIRCDAAQLYGTSLTASNFWDIHHTVSRMMQEKQSSYKETLYDSSDIPMKPYLGRSLTTEILETVKKLESTLSVSIGELHAYVFPSSFDDTRVLIVKLDESQAIFQENEFSHGITNDLNVKFNDLKISLSKSPVITEDFVNECSVEEFMTVARQATGGDIFLFPSYQISMRTYQKFQENIIEYFYRSSFGGMVNVKWNLGSVNLIREMITMHKQTLETRRAYNQVEGNSLNEDVFNKTESKTLNEGMFDKTDVNGDIVEKAVDDSSVFNENIFENNSRSSSKEIDPREEIESVIEEKIDKVASESKYTYVPLVPPIIAAPQLKELGNATPPLEWFGLHRDKFPSVTHQVGIVSLQNLIHEVEKQYSKLLGKA